MTENLKSQLWQIFQLVQTNFIFKEDYGLESWEMPPPGYDGKQQIRDDCDGFCLACRSLLRKANIPSRLVYCEINQEGQSFGHLVVEAEGWIMDNLQIKVLPNTSVYLRHYNWLRISGYEPGEEWYEIVNYSRYG